MRIKERRIELGISKSDMSKLSKIDLKRYIEIERGRVRCSFKELYILSMILRIPITKIKELA